MKKISACFSVCTVLSMLVLCSSSAQSQWVQTNGISTAVYDFVQNGEYLFAGGYGTGIYRWNESSARWEEKNNGLKLPKEFSAFMVIGSDLIVYIDHVGFYRSTDNGDSWTAINTEFYWDIEDLAMIGNVLIAGGDNIWTSTDEGVTWSTITELSGNKHIFSLLAVGPDIFAGHYDGTITRSIDSGKTWMDASDGLKTYQVNTLVSNGQYLFAGTVARLYRSSNNGLTWTDAHNGISNPSINHLVVNDTDLFAITGNGIFFSDDTGNNWTSVHEGIWMVPQGFALAVRGAYLYAGIGFNSVWRRPLAEFLDVKTDNDLPLSITIAPNPTTGIVTARSPVEFERITIVNILGQKVMEFGEPASTEFTIDLSSMPRGTYFFLCSAMGTTTSRMVIRE